MVNLFLSILCFSSLWAKTDYTLADLEVLAGEGSEAEFFEHALDVRPSERQEAWKTMVGKVADSYSQKVLQKSEVSLADFKQTETLYSWPSLKQDDVFRLRRQGIGLKYLKACLKKDRPCWGELKAFWERDKTDADTAFHLAELTAGESNSPLSTWSLLEVALKSPLSEFYCKKEFAMEALWGKIEMDYVRLGSQGDLMAKIDQTIHPDCVPILIGEARKRLLAPPKSSDRELSYQILESQGKADEGTKDFFLTVYLLETPSQGELFNYSWNRVKELGRNSSRREQVLQKIQGLSPLPDGILSSLDQKKKRVILSHFKSNFPEYLQYYTDQCVNFYGGKGSFPSGNPTRNCQSFMQSDLAPVIIDEFKIKKYQEVIKI